MGTRARQYRLAPRARADLEGIWRYTAERWLIDQADRYHNTLMHTIESLVDAPHRGVAVDAVRLGYRHLRAGSHVIFYRIYGETIEIVRILHARMDFARHL